MTKKPTLTPIESKTSKQPSMREFYQSLEIDVLARTLWGEARGEGTAGMEAVAQVILNRVKVAEERGRYWWGNNIIQVCQKPYQFSCWNRSDPNFRKLQAVDERDLHFATAVRIARRAVAGVLKQDRPDDHGVAGATHYHAAGITPYWARNEPPVTVIGRHIFYRLV